MAAIKPMRAALAAACALAGVSSLPARAVEVDAAAMVYSETDRVQAVEPVVSLTHRLGDFRTLRLKLTLDTLTGASPSGAVPSASPQTYTRPSGHGSYVVPAGATPLDDTFHDQRVDGTLSLEQRFGLLTRLTGGLRGSSEYDYTSFGGNVVLQREFDRRNRALTAGLSFSADDVRPEGGVPTPLAAMAAAGEALPREGSSDSKQLADLLLGVTQIVDRSTVLQLNYSLSRSSGYLTDPYKLVSVVAAAGEAAAGEPVATLHEARPDSRQKQSLFGRIKRHLGGDVVDLSYRFLSDDWGLRSHTAELRYHWRIQEGRALVPHLRWYRQGEADFYRHSLVAGESLPEFASADPRLAAFDAWTFGLKVRQSLADGSEVSARFEYYRQRGDSSPADAIGQLKEQDLFADLDAFILQFGYRFKLFE